ncbi:MAG: hypothetical protein IKL62_05170 [Clostridia bacterium]|nr:hypothetical protein [Clostridia bacterium]
MDMTFTDNSGYSWSISGDKIIYGKRELSISSLVLVRYCYPEDGPYSVNGFFTFHYSEEYSDNVLLAFATNQKEKAKEAADYILNIVGKERFINVKEEPNSPKMSILKKTGKAPTPKDIFWARVKILGPIIAIIIIGLIILIASSVSDSSSSNSDNNSKDGFIGSDGKYHEYVPEFGDDVNNWMEENW